MAADDVRWYRRRLVPRCCRLLPPPTRSFEAWGKGDILTGSQDVVTVWFEITASRGAELYFDGNAVADGAVAKLSSAVAVTTYVGDILVGQ